MGQFISEIPNTHGIFELNSFERRVILAVIESALLDNYNLSELKRRELHAVAELLTKSATLPKTLSQSTWDEFEGIVQTAASALELLQRGIVMARNAESNAPTDSLSDLKKPKGSSPLQEIAADRIPFAIQSLKQANYTNTEFAELATVKRILTELEAGRTRFPAEDLEVIRLRCFPTSSNEALDSHSGNPFHSGLSDRKEEYFIKPTEIFKDDKTVASKGTNTKLEEFDELVLTLAPSALSHYAIMVAKSKAEQETALSLKERIQSLPTADMHLSAAEKIFIQQCCDHMLEYRDAQRSKENPGGQE